MANYIKYLEQDQAAQMAQVTTLETGIAELRAYLASDKFRSDTTVQVADVDRRLQEILSAGADGYLAGQREFIAKEKAKAA
jgi:hypothetical protein